MQHDLLTAATVGGNRFFVRLLDEHLLVVDFARHELRVLNPAGAALWLLLNEGPATPDVLAGSLAGLFRIGAAEAVRDVVACLDDWLALEWIEEAGGGELRLIERTTAAPRATDLLPAAEGEEPPELPLETVRVRMLGTEVALQLGSCRDSIDDDLVPRLRAVLGGFPPATAGASGVGPAALTLVVTGERIWVGSSAGWSWTADSSDALSHVVLCLFRAGHPDARIVATIHAAAVGLGQRGLVLMPGLSGNGKSTLAAWLAARGWSYAGDDIVALAVAPAGAPLLLPFPTAISVKPGSWPVLARDYPELMAAPVVPYAGKQARFLPIPAQRHVGPDAAQRTVRAIVFPRHVPGSAAAALEPISTLTTVLELVACGITTGGPLDPERLARLFDFLEEMPCYRLSFPCLETAQECLASLLP